MSIKRRALGRGLAALIPGAGAPAAPSGPTLMVQPIKGWRWGRRYGAGEAGGNGQRLVRPGRDRGHQVVGGKPGPERPADGGARRSTGRSNSRGKNGGQSGGPRRSPGGGDRGGTPGPRPAAKDLR